jgi:uncharacterized membrane protein
MALALLVLLGLGVTAWQWPNLRAGSSWALLFVLPLLAPLHGLIRGRLYTFRWATLLVAGYVAIGITEVIATPARRLAPAFILFTAFALILALVAYIRLAAAPRSR